MAAGKSTANLAASLVRFSPRPNPEDARSLEVQVERNEAYAALAGITIVQTFRDPEVSARKIPLAKREGGAAMLAYLAEHKEIRHVVVQKLDRAFRNTEDGLGWLRRWKKDGITLHLSDQGGITLNAGTATGRLVLTFLLGIAEYEPAQTSERTSIAMKHHQRNGRRQSGRLPFGYKMVGEAMLPDPEEMELGRRMVELHDRGMGQREIARELGPFYTRGALHHTLVRKVLSTISMASST